jgi:RNase P subunit RPR2
VGNGMAKRRDKEAERATAERRMRTLLARARAEHLADRASPLPDRYAALTLRLAQRYQTGLPREAKTQVCRACGAYRTPSSSRTRLGGRRITTTCLRCGAVARRPLDSRPVTSRAINQRAINSRPSNSRPTESGESAPRSGES